MVMYLTLFAMKQIALYIDYSMSSNFISKEGLV